MDDVSKTLITGLCYLFFHVEFFRYTSHIFKHEKLNWIRLLCTGILNYVVFIICSLLHLHLIVNWFVFFCLLYAEIRILFPKPLRESLLMSLLGCLLGLAVNIFFRSFFAMVLDIPLYVFDNELVPGNMKAYPILLGFVLTGLAFWLANHQLPLDRVRLILDDQKNLTFLLSLFAAMYLYLGMNLVVYDSGENSIIVKLWSMKSSVFVIVGELLAVILSMKMGQINEYRREYARGQQIIEEEKLREQELRVIAILDPLTACENQAEAIKYIDQAMEHKEDFSLIFVDLNKLKQVNDQYGHEMGDQYLLSVSSVLKNICFLKDKLFRYGGDEFVVILHNTDTEEATSRMELAKLNLVKLARDTPFEMSFSYGITESKLVESRKELISKADQSMYDMKQRMRS